MKLWVEVTRLESEGHFVAFGDDGFGRELGYVLTTDLAGGVTMLNLK